MPSKYLIRNFRENCNYHIFNRGVEKRTIFTCPKDYQVFIRYLKIYLLHPNSVKQLFPYAAVNLTEHNLHQQVNLLSYCLMPNHFHLQIQPKDPSSIPQLMKQLSNAYTIYFNTTYDRVGSLFQGTYKAAEINTHELNIHVHRYIHLNPIVANLTKSLENYPWSSYHEYINPNQTTNICLTNNILHRFKNLKSYQNFLLSQLDQPPQLESLTID